MNGVKIVTNAVSDLTPEAARQLDVTIIPECIIFGDRQYYSFLDFQPPELYRMMADAPKPPTGSQPNIGMYLDAFQSLEGQCEEIICINMTSRMSGSYNTALMAKDMLEEEDFPARIHVFDSLELTHGMGFLVRIAAGMAKEGATAEEILQKLTESRGKIGIYFVMKSLETARRGGRLGAIKTVLADSLNLKPILMFRDGIETDVEVVRSFSAALEHLVPYYEKQADFGRHVTIFHADNEADAETVRDRIAAIDPAAEISIEWLGSGIGIYTGAGCVGITYWEK